MYVMAATSEDYLCVYAVRPWQATLSGGLPRTYLTGGLAFPSTNGVTASCIQEIDYPASRVRVENDGESGTDSG